MTASKKRYAILRTEKIKSWATLAKSVGHNLRTSNERREHLDPNCPNPLTILAGSSNFLKEWKQQVEGMHLRKLQQGQSHTLAREFLLTMSPEWAHGKTEKQIQAWAEANVSWAKNRFGPERVKLAVLHLDEQTPHIALYVVGLTADPKNRGNGWTLSDRAIGLGASKASLVTLQDEYAAAMKPFGLARGEPGSRATHQRTKAWRNQMAAAEAALQQVKAPKALEPTLMDRVSIEAYGDKVAKHAAQEVFRQMKPIYATARARDKKLREQEAMLKEVKATVEKLAPMAALAEAFLSLLEALMGHRPQLNTLQGQQEAQGALKAIYQALKPQRPEARAPRAKPEEARSPKAPMRPAEQRRPGL